MSTVELNQLQKRLDSARGMIVYWQCKNPECASAWSLTVEGLESRLEREANKLEHFALLNTESMCYKPLMLQVNQIRSIIERM